MSHSIKVPPSSTEFTNIGSGSWAELRGETGQESGRIDKVAGGFSIHSIPRTINSLDILDNDVSNITGGENQEIEKLKAGHRDDHKIEEGLSDSKRGFA